MLTNHKWREIGFLFAPDDGTNPPAGGDPPGAGVETEEIETVFVSSPEEIPQENTGPSFDPEELKRQNEDLQSRLEALQQQADVATQLNQGISQLGETLKKGQGQGQGQQPPPPQAKGETEAEYAERIKKEFYDDPYHNLQDMTQRTMQPFLNQVVNNNVAMSRRLMTLDPQKSENFKAYAEEIDQAVAQMPPMTKLQDPMVYDKAYEQVVARHMDEIIEKSVAQRLAEAQAQNPGNGSSAPSTAQNSHVEHGHQPPSGGPRKNYAVLTPQEKTTAFNKGLTQQQYYDYLKRKGLK